MHLSSISYFMFKCLLYFHYPLIIQPLIKIVIFISLLKKVIFCLFQAIFVVFKISVQVQLSVNSMVIMGLCAIQILIILAYALPIQSKQANLVIGKYLIQLFSTITYIPSIFISVQNLLNHQSIYISLFTLLMTLINRLLFISMHFQFSIQGLIQNILIRNPISTTKQLINFFLIIIYMLCQSFLYPMSLIIYFIINIVFCLYQVKEYCIGFNYHHQAIPKLIGILKIMNISLFLCYLIVIATQITLVKNNILTFILAFFTFFANFFLIFKKYATKSIVIDSDGDNQTKKIIFIMWYFNCFRNRAEKKNQLYLSSLLKNHSSQCNQVTCCCQKRNFIYDPSTNTFGSPTSQPHQDLVYIKHFFLKLLTQTYNEFPKCNQILFLLAFYNLQILNFIPKTIELIKQLKKKSLKKNLTFSQDYVLHCLGQRCYSKINQINHNRGNLDLEQARTFDLKILQLKQTIKFSVQTFSSLWKTICSQKYNQKNLVQICKIALQVMFKIQQTYKDIKNINNVSTELKQLMIFYSKSVAHDIHLLSEIRKQIKLNAQKTILSNLTEIKGINIFSPDTITLITSQISNIRWASKNCYTIFGYNDRQQFLKLKINDLMPKYFSQNHDLYINKWLQNGYSTKLNKSTYLWGSTKQGYCFSLALYLKIIPLQKQQDFAFFAAIQKIDIDNEIICNEEGQILGCGKLFASTIKCSQKSIQDYKPNIQVLMPSTFQLFLEHFFPQKKNPPQLLVQVRRQGYFPKNLQKVLKQIFKQKQSFMNKNNRKSNYKQLLSSFLKQKMQQITVYMDGQYISLISTIHQLPVLQNKKKKIIILKLTGIKKNNVQKYYNELQKMITKLESIKKQNKTIKKKKSMKYQSSKSLKKDYFKVFLNPKRVKKILEQQDDQKINQKQMQEQPEQYGRLNAIYNPDHINELLSSPKHNSPSKQSNSSKNLQQGDQKNQKRKRTQKDSCLVDPQKIIGYRKKLALNAQFQIKNQRAKYNIWKMKKALFEQGIFSRYTYNMLVGKGNDFESLRNIHAIHRTLHQIQDPFATINNYYEQEGNSDQQLTSQNLTNKAQVQNVDKPNDNETFNSATSSAAFISMTNSIKMFKIKLRSLNTPKLLYWLNVGLILLILLVAGFGLWLWIQQVKQTQLGQIYFSKCVQSTWVIDSILMSKLIIQKLQYLQNNIQYYTTFSSNYPPDYYNKTINQLNRISNLYLNVLHDIISVQLLQYSQLQKKDQDLLQYLFIMIPLNQTLQNNSKLTNLKALQFIMRQQDYAKQKYNVRNQKQIDYLVKQNIKIYQNNVYYTKLRQIDQNLFISGLLAFILALIISIPIVYKIQSKVQQIMYLISKISLNQRKKYYLQFTLLSQQLKNMQQTQSWSQLQNIQQTKLSTLYNKTNLSQDLFKQQKKTKSKKNNQSKHKNVKVKFYSTIYFKIIIIYLIFLIMYSAKFVYIKIIFDNYLTQNSVFTQVLTQKLIFTQQALLFNQYLNDNNTDTLNLGQSKLVQQIYNSYHLQEKDVSDYDDFILNLTTSDICQKILNFTTNSDNPIYLSYFKLNSLNQLAQCQKLSNSTLSNGLFDTLDFIQQKRKDIINQSLSSRNKFILSQNSIILQKLTYYTNTMNYIIQNQLKNQVHLKKAQIIFQMSLWLLIVGGVLLAFTMAWIFIYLNIAQRASYINAFLLLIPYQVLSQNPYIKLYIKNQFDYKASVY